MNHQKPDNYLVWAILSTAFCCVPLGIASIVYASKVDSLWQLGQRREAIDASVKAKKFAVWGFVVTLVAAFLYALFYLIFFIVITTRY